MLDGIKGHCSNDVYPSAVSVSHEPPVVIPLNWCHACANGGVASLVDPLQHQQRQRHLRTRRQGKVDELETIKKDVQSIPLTRRSILLGVQWSANLDAAVHLGGARRGNREPGEPGNARELPPLICRCRLLFPPLKARSTRFKPSTPRNLLMVSTTIYH
jgi:hypothetical protein